MILTLLVYFDAILTVMGGVEGNPIWRFFTERWGVWFDLVAAALVLFLFYAVILISAPIAKKIDGYSNAHEVILTNLVIVYAIYDFYFILNQFGLPFAANLFNSRGLLIAALLIPGIIPYNIFLEIKKHK